MNNINLKNSLEKLDREMRRLNSQESIILKQAHKIAVPMSKLCARNKIFKYAFTDPEKCEDARKYLNRIKLNPLYEKPFVWIDFENWRLPL